MFRKSLSQILFLSIAILLSDCKNGDNRNDLNKVSSQEYSEETEQNKEVESLSIPSEWIDLESEYSEMLQPIADVKKSNSKVYWFIVSWLKTNYKTPDWTGYYSEDWKRNTKQSGIDCSGFSRVMLDQIFNQKVSGGSTMLLNTYCTPTGKSSLTMGDLVFFRAPYSSNDKIVHVGVYLKDSYFVHATSTKSAAKGLGLSINSLEEENWSKEFVTGGKVKE